VSGPDVERLLERALAPVEPPADLASRLRGALAALGESAVGELEAWERAAMRAPRHGARLALGLAAGAAAALGVLLQGRRRAE
jgi:hypothetical protein